MISAGDPASLPLAKEGTLSAVAQAYSDDMLRRGFFSHTNPEGLTVRDRLSPYFSGSIRSLGENIWEGSNLSAANREALARYIMNSWMSSSGHRENILGADYTIWAWGLLPWAGRSGPPKISPIFKAGSPSPGRGQIAAAWLAGQPPGSERPGRL